MKYKYVPTKTVNAYTQAERKPRSVTPKKKSFVRVNNTDQITYRLLIKFATDFAIPLAGVKLGTKQLNAIEVYTALSIRMINRQRVSEHKLPAIDVRHLFLAVYKGNEKQAMLANNKFNKYKKIVKHYLKEVDNG